MTTIITIKGANGTRVITIPEEERISSIVFKSSNENQHEQ